MITLEPFRRAGVWGGPQLEGYAPQFEVKEMGDGYLFRADLPGVEEKDLEVTLTGNRLTVSGKREAEQRSESETYYVCERSYGTFSRAFTLPEDVEPESVTAALDNGVLALKVAKKTASQPKKISVRQGAEKGTGKAVPKA